MDKSNANKPGNAINAGKMERSNNVSPYLLRRLRSVDQVIEERERDAAPSTRWEAAGSENLKPKPRLQSV